MASRFRDAIAIEALGIAGSRGLFATNSALIPTRVSIDS
jgi:hypothetical protein